MNPGNHNLVVHKGATFSEYIEWRDELGNAINLTGYTAKMHVRTSAQSNTLLFDLTTENGMISFGAEVGSILLEISDEITADLPWGKCVYDLMLTPPNGKTVKLLQGTIEANTSVTRV